MEEEEAAEEKEEKAEEVEEEEDMEENVAVVFVVAAVGFRNGTGGGGRDAVVVRVTVVGSLGLGGGEGEGEDVGAGFKIVSSTPLTLTPLISIPAGAAAEAAPAMPLVVCFSECTPVGVGGTFSKSASSSNSPSSLTSWKAKRGEGAGLPNSKRCWKRLLPSPCAGEAIVGV